MDAAALREQRGNWGELFTRVHFVTGQSRFILEIQMRYVQFFQKSVTTPHRLIEACGDRSVVILDGREATRSHNDIAREECEKRGYLAYQLCKGETFTRASPYGPVVSVY